MMKSLLTLPFRAAHAVGRRGWRVVRHVRFALTARPAREVFDVWATDGRANTMEHAHGPVVRGLIDRLGLAPNARFLDVGCGNGYAVRWAADRLPQGRAVGIDVSPQMISCARRLSTAYPHVEFYEFAFPRHQLPLRSFDAVFAMETAYYFPDLPEALAEIRQLLKPGGLFVSAVDYYREHRESHGWPEYVGTPMKLLDAAGWRRAFEDAGFTAVRQERLVVPEAEAVERWHATVGSLVTSGRSPG